MTNKIQYSILLLVLVIICIITGFTKLGAIIFSIGCISLLSPPLLQYQYKKLTIVFERLAKAKSFLLLTIIYFVVLIPTAILFRLTRRSALRKTPFKLQQTNVTRSDFTKMW